MVCLLQCQWVFSPLPSDSWAIPFRALQREKVSPTNIWPVETDQAIHDAETHFIEALQVKADLSFCKSQQANCRVVVTLEKDIPIIIEAETKDFAFAFPYRWL